MNRDEIASRIGVWSELPDPNSPDGKGKDCSYSSYLMCLVWGGVRKFPLGIYSVEEREAFERSDDYPDEIGTIGYGVCDTASQRRYGVTLHKGTDAGLVALLNTPNMAVAIQGTGPGLPSKVAVNHSIALVTQGAGWVVDLDPMRPHGSKLPCTTVDVIVAWHKRLGKWGEIRYCALDEFATTPPAPAPGPSSVTYRVKRGDTLAGIARAYHVSLGLLWLTNVLRVPIPRLMRVGTVLTIPA